MILVTVSSVRSVPGMKGRKARVEVKVLDAEGVSLQCVFFNQTWRERQLRAGTDMTISGKMEFFRRQRQMVNPVVDLVGRSQASIPIYPQSARSGLTSEDFALMVDEALRRCSTRGIADPVPRQTLDRLSLCSRWDAFVNIHTSHDVQERERARKRLVFDELLRMQLALAVRREEARSLGSVQHSIPKGLLVQFRVSLPFEFTKAQEKATGEILGDMARNEPMQRLLHGEVGSGKTVVALAAMLVAAGGGHQAALMAPTEVLAEQHFANLTDLLSGGLARGFGGGAQAAGGRGLQTARWGVNLDLLTGRSRPEARRRVISGLASGEVDMVVGTHALIAEGVEFRSLGLAVIDEQHRFGVEQRAALRSKSASGAPPDVLVMTATPIPRTTAMTVYGDLDVSRLDEMPKGRPGVTTKAIWTLNEVGEVWEHLRREVEAGRQAYVVCPVISESDTLETAAAEKVHAALEGDQLSGLRLGLLHGRVRAAERERVMREFREGRLAVMVATTMIEVGVDVPNATVMVILGADRFGIAQLHQLRGRVGRGDHRGCCYLVSGDPVTGLGLGLVPLDSSTGNPRIEALVQHSDGFELAEIDLELRGEGTLMSERQTGSSDLRLASLRRDFEWVKHARDVAQDLVRNGPLPDALRDELDACVSAGEAEFLEKA